MVFSGEKQKRSEEEMERLNPLHNFDLPCLKWGNQKLLRCMKVDSRGSVSSAAVDRKHSSESGGGGGGGMSVNGARRRDVELERRLFRSSGDRKVESFYKLPSSEKMKAKAGDGEIEATREKLMSDFQTEVGKMKDAILRGSLVYPSPASVPAPAPTPATEATATASTSPMETPWNLRTRRAAYNGSGSSRVDDLKPNVSPLVRNECNRSVGGGGGCGTATAPTTATATTSGEKRDRSKFAISLSRRELEEDFTAMTGRRLPRKPKKRPRIIQKQLDTLFPGLWLTEITADLYRVPEDPETTTGKR